VSIASPACAGAASTARARRVSETQPCPVRGLLLDFGSVISVSVFERHRETESLLGIPSGSLTWRGPLEPATDALWQAMQRDEITERQYWDRRAQEVGQAVGESDWNTRTFLERVRQAEPDRVVRPEMELLIRQSKELGLRIGILSNELELFYGKAFLERLTMLRDIDVLIDATHTGILKPDIQSYRQAVEALELAPDQVLFVDDQFRNIAGAVRAGLQTHYFDLRDVDGNIAAIRARLRLPTP
jgi:putative hydrolase of the HAD superfamily